MGINEERVNKSIHVNVTKMSKEFVGETDFTVRVEVQQASALSPYLFSLVMKEITKDI